jgi:RNA polymerase sigma-70 factor, ECF subfamily
VAVEHLVVERLFRRSAGRISATLVRALGSEHLDLVEDAIQEALLRALRRWPFDGVPGNPAGWLFVVARNHVLGALRRDDALRRRVHLLVPESAEPTDELALVFLCCHPRLPVASQVALTLRIAGGLGVEEIAAALLVSPSAVAQRIVRAKRELRRLGLDVPGERVDAVLTVLYLLFNAGYDAPAGDRVVRRELCAEAIRLCRLLVADPRTDRPDVRALLALMLLHGSRLTARGDDVVLLADQDRTLWDRRMIDDGIRVFASACTGETASAFHTEAAIALCHVAPETDWDLVVSLYDELLRRKPSPVVALNRAVAVAMRGGIDPGELRRLRDDPALRGYHQLPAVLGALWLRAGEPAVAAELYAEALTRECSAPTRRFLERQLARSGGGHGHRL